MARTNISYDDGHIYEFTPELEPVYTAEDGEQLTVETVDSLEKEVQSEDHRLESIPEEINAATGPIAIEGATCGDVLKVDIEAVRVNEDRGRVITAPGFGLLHEWRDVEHPATRITPVDADAQTIEFENATVPIDPVIGTIGVATADESISTLTPHDHGGNLDTTDMTAGSTVYFPVFQRGGLLAMGDSKAAMADGEMCGTGAEIGTDIDITVSLIESPELSLKRPLVRTSDSWKTIASADTIEEAVKLANRDLIGFLEREHELSTTEAYMLSSLVGGLEISQVVDPMVTARNAIPREYLSNPFPCDH